MNLRYSGKPLENGDENSASRKKGWERWQDYTALT